MTIFVKQFREKRADKLIYWLTLTIDEYSKILFFKSSIQKCMTLYIYHEKKSLLFIKYNIFSGSMR